MKKYLIIQSILIYFIISCNKTESIVFKESKHLYTDTIPFNAIFHPTFITLTDSILVFSSYNTDPLLHFYKTPHLKYMYGTGRKGQNFDEFQAFPMICQNSRSNKLHIWGYTPIKINEFIFTNDSFKLSKSHILDKYNTFNQLHIVRDSLFIYNSVPTELSIKKYNLKLKKETGSINFDLDSNNQPFYSSNYGLVSANDSFIVYAYTYKKQIDIYNISTLELNKRIIDKYNFKNPIINDNENNTEHYINIISGKKYFYALHRGKSSKNTTFNTDIIEVFDYNGNPILKYSFDISPQIFIVDEENRYMYGYNNKYEDYILRYKL